MKNLFMKILYFLLISHWLIFSGNTEDAALPNGDSPDYVSCGNLLFSAAKKGLLVSEDNGQTWKKQTNFPEIRAAKIHAEGFDLFVHADHYGLYYSADCGKTWETISKIFEYDEEMVQDCGLNPSTNFQGGFKSQSDEHTEFIKDQNLQL
jgi:photosystem II stability/assembly factor-like uncharacterized protein